MALGFGARRQKKIGDDIRTAEFGWPIGMSLCRALKGYKGFWETHLQYYNHIGGYKDIKEVITQGNV